MEAHHFINLLSSGLKESIRANYRQLERAKKLSYKAYLTTLRCSISRIFIVIIVTVNIVLWWGKFTFLLIQANWIKKGQEQSNQKIIYHREHFAYIR